MNRERLQDLIGRSVTSSQQITPEALCEVLTDEELLQAVRSRGLRLGSLAVDACDTPEVNEKGKMQKRQEIPYAYINGYPYYNRDEYEYGLEEEIWLNREYGE